ncbi:MAG: response regulator [Verrucomicrobia bacterium]|nr:response regulator [Verrucomicrobiota bacterium]
MRILFVENHAQFVNVVTRNFLGGHEVTPVPSLAGAWALLTEETFDVVLVDYDLVDGKGDELVRKIKASSLPVKIVAVSAHDRGNTALREAGAEAVCSKMTFSGIGSVLASIG